MGGTRLCCCCGQGHCRTDGEWVPLYGVRVQGVRGEEGEVNGYRVGTAGPSRVNMKRESEDGGEDVCIAAA